MELFVAIMIYLGILTPEASAQISAEELNMLVSQNHTVIENIAQDPQNPFVTGSGLEIDRRED